VDCDDAGVSDRRPQKRDLEHPGASYIADELPAAGEVTRVLLPAERSADALA
jgi:hypothetical protein